MYDDSQSVLRPAGRSYYGALISFPIACFVSTFLTDLAYLATDSFVWETFLGLVADDRAGGRRAGGRRRLRGPGAQPTRARARPALLRVLGEVVAIGLSLVNVFVHSRDGCTAVVPEGLILSALAVLVLVATLFVGRHTSFTRTRGLA